MPNAFGQGCKSVPPCEILQFKYWSGHRAFWNNNNAKKQHNDRASLLIHFLTWLKELMNSLPYISDCFEVTFLQEPRNQQKLDVLESMWINKLVAEININKTILPKYLKFWFAISSKALVGSRRIFFALELLCEVSFFLVGK